MGFLESQKGEYVFHYMEEIKSTRAENMHWYSQSRLNSRMVLICETRWLNSLNMSQVRHCWFKSPPSRRSCIVISASHTGSRCCIQRQHCYQKMPSGTDMVSEHFNQRVKTAMGRWQFDTFLLQASVVLCFSISATCCFMTRPGQYESPQNEYQRDW